MAKAPFFLLFIVVLVLAAAPGAKADPLSFSNVVALQNNGSTQVDLYSNPGITLLGPQISFLVNITGTLPQGVSNTLVITYTEAGSAPITQSFQIPLFGNIAPPFTLLFTLTSPNPTVQGTLATLTVDILGSSPDFTIPGGSESVDGQTYSFLVAQPVPEPASIVIFGTGLFGLIRRLRSRRRGNGLDV